MSTDSSLRAADAVDGCWEFSRSRGFLIDPDPVADLRQVDPVIGSEAAQSSAFSDLHSWTSSTMRSDFISTSEASRGACPATDS
jgi:hypothetical protein